MSSRPGARRSRARSRPRPGAASATTSRSSARWPPQRPNDAALAAAAEVATPGVRRLAAYLRDEYAPAADPRDPVGRDRYALFARDFNGIELDLDETYAWGWEELHRIEDAMRHVGERILPGASIDEVIEHLDADDHRAIEGVDEFRRWNQDLIDQTISDLNGTHFDIAPPLLKCEAMIAPPGGAAAMYYTGPTEDFSRPGRTWYPTMGETRFPAVEGSQHLLPRGGARPSPAGRAGRVHGREAVAVPAPVRLRLRSRRRVGAVRRTTDG